MLGEVPKLLVAAIALPCVPVACLTFVFPSCAHTHPYTHLHTHASHTCPGAPSPNVSPRPHPPHPNILCLVPCWQDSHLHSDGTFLEADSSERPLLTCSDLLVRKGQQNCLLCISLAMSLIWYLSVSALRHHPSSKLAWLETENKRHC